MKYLNWRKWIGDSTQHMQRIHASHEHLTSSSAIRHCLWFKMKVGRFNDDTDSECGWNGHWFAKKPFLLMFSEAVANGTNTKNVHGHYEILTAASLCSIPGWGISEGVCAFVCVGVLLLAQIHQPCLKHGPTPYHRIRNSSMIFVRSRNVFFFVFFSHKKSKSNERTKLK